MSAPARMPAGGKGGGAAAAEQRPVRAVSAPAPHQAAPSGQKRKRSARRVVWVKYGMQPHWPALVADPSDGDVPPCTLTRPPDDVVPVRYFGDGCWQWVSATKCVDFNSYYEQHANAPGALGRPDFLPAVAAAKELVDKRKRMKAQSAAKPGAASGGARTTTTTTPSVQVQRPKAAPASLMNAAAQPAPASAPPVREPPRARAAPVQAASPAAVAAQQQPAQAPASPPVPQPPRAQPRPVQAASPAAASPPPAQAESREVMMLRMALKRKRAEMARHASEAARHAAEAAFHAAEAECIDLEIKLASLT